MTTKVFSADPGETTGWAYQDERDDYPGGLLDLGQIKGLQPLTEFLEKWDLVRKPIDHVVIEGYKVWGGKRGQQANTGSELETVRAIGILESWCFRNKLSFSKAYSDDNKLTALQVGLDPFKGAHKKTHWVFAANHGRKWLQDRGLAKNAAQRAMLNGKK